MRIVVDPGLCQGHGFCYMNTPALFTDDDIGHAHVHGSGDVAPDEEEAARAATWNCPELAISVVD